MQYIYIPGHWITACRQRVGIDGSTPPTQRNGRHRSLVMSPGFAHTARTGGDRMIAVRAFLCCPAAFLVHNSLWPRLLATVTRWVGRVAHTSRVIRRLWGPTLLSIFGIPYFHTVCTLSSVWVLSNRRGPRTRLVCVMVSLIE